MRYLSLTQYTSPDHFLEYVTSMARLAISIPNPGPYPSLSDPNIPGITFSKERGWDFHAAPDNMNFALPIKITNQHYEQMDTSLNKAIWGDLPATKAELDAAEQAVDDNLKNLL